MGGKAESFTIRQLLWSLTIRLLKLLKVDLTGSYSRLNLARFFDRSIYIYTYRLAKKTRPACFIANILKTARPNCVEILPVLACLFTDHRPIWWRHNWCHSFIYFQSHYAVHIMRHVQRNNVAFIQPDVWPPVSPDLNPVDYAVWGGGGHLLVYQHWSFMSLAN